MTSARNSFSVSKDGVKYLAADINALLGYEASNTVETASVRTFQATSSR